ncbi:MAG TPA: ABC transporter substrate-binding protein [Verrucomicrobiae bacterium]|jgi:ABC-type uncharacterized transport system substrate-binding protein|nr:ABC transporter substrate-binding protein [Verrucomicrobiae bacterium]
MKGWLSAVGQGGLCLIVATMFFALCVPTGAQQTKKLPRIGILLAGSFTTSQSSTDAFRRGLTDLGYVEGKDIVIEYRFAEGKEQRLPTLAAELVRLGVDIIVVGGGSASSAAKDVTKTIPIVMATASDPVRSGLVTSLARPGGNITGFTLIGPDLSGKRLEVLKEMIPGLVRVAVLVYRNNPATDLMLKETETAAVSLGLQLQTSEVRASREGQDALESAFAAAKKNHSEAINILSSAFFNDRRKEIGNLAVKTRLPTMYPYSSFTEAGGLISYGPNLLDLYRRAAVYVDKILKGAKPANLPVEQPTKFELVINLKAAKQIGLTIPPNVLARADRVIK